MKNMILKSLLVTSLLSTGALAYDASSVNVMATGYKTAGKVAVPTTFDKVTLSVKKNDSFKKFISSASVKIDVMSINSKMKFRDNNITSTLFKLSGFSEITANVKSVKGNNKKGVLKVEINMNNVKKVVSMPYTVTANTLKAEASIDVLDFSMNKGFKAFAAKCKAFHANKTFSDVKVAFELPFTK